MNTSAINGSAAAYTGTTTTKVDTSKKTNEGENTTAKDTEVKEEAASAGVVYEKGTETEKKATYTIHKMSADDRAALVQQLKADQENRQNQLMDIVKQMMTGQATTFSQANGDDDIWKFLASGEYTVDEAAKAQAQKEISEDGYYGVKQTSQRLFDFASALAGDDTEKMKEMQKAMEKGFKEATSAWGKELPSICKDTLDAANKMFEDYYASKESSVTEKAEQTEQAE